MDSVGPFGIEKLPDRRFILNLPRNANYKQLVCGLVEYDVTAARRKILEYRRRSATPVSFLAWFVKCLAQAASEHPELGCRHAGGRTAGFKDVDVVVFIGRLVDGRSFIFPVTVQRANCKEISAITEEINAVDIESEDLKHTPLFSDEKRQFSEWLVRWSADILRRLFWRILKVDFFWHEDAAGLISVISPGMSEFAERYDIPGLSFDLGSITRKAVAAGDGCAVRQYLPAKLLAGRRVANGTHLDGFITGLNKLLGEAWGLDWPSGTDKD
jgi:hypothetical protein